MIQRAFGRFEPGPAALAVPRLTEILPFLREPLPSPPSQMSWTANVIRPFDILGNDTTNDCALAGAANLDRIVSAAAGNERFPLPAAVDEVFRQMSPDGSGLYLTDVMQSWKAGGLPLMAPSRPKAAIGRSKIIGYVALNPQNLDQLRWAILWFGGVYLGFNMPALTLTDVSTWRVTSNPADMLIKGRHCVVCSTYMQAGFSLLSWARFFLATQDFMVRFCEEAYAVVFEDWVMPSGFTPSGFSRSELEDRIRALSSAAA